MFKIPNTYHVGDRVVVFDTQHFQDPLDIEDGLVSVFHRNYDWRHADEAVEEHHFMNECAKPRLWESHFFKVRFKDGLCDPYEMAEAVDSILQKCGYHGVYVEAVKVIKHPNENPKPWDGQPQTEQRMKAAALVEHPREGTNLPTA